MWGGSTTVLVVGIQEVREGDMGSTRHRLHNLVIDAAAGDLHAMLTSALELAPGVPEVPRFTPPPACMRRTFPLPVPFHSTESGQQGLSVGVFPKPFKVPFRTFLPFPPPDPRGAQKLLALILSRLRDLASAYAENRLRSWDS